MRYYQFNITETATGESITFWDNTLNLDVFKKAKAELLKQVDNYNTEHVLTITQITDNQNCHWLGANTEKTITKITAGTNNWVRFLSRIF